MRIILWGAGNYAKAYINAVDAEILCIYDNDPKKWGTTFNGHRVLKPFSFENCAGTETSTANREADRIVIAVADDTICGLSAVCSILAQLKEHGVPPTKIYLPFRRYNPNKEYRLIFLKKLAKQFYDDGIYGDVAEVGVFKGHFAAHINDCFPDRRLHLFDTFEGFVDEEVEKDLRFHNGFADMVERVKSFHNPKMEHFSLDYLVSLRCPHPENITIVKGAVPLTFQGYENKKFSFVNIDTDLYEPIRNSLEFFGERMVAGGVILVHDYYHKEFRGAKIAVDEVTEHKKMTKIPLAGCNSIILIPKI